MEENQYCKMYKYIDTLPMFGNWEADTAGIFLCGLGSVVLIGGKISLFIFFACIVGAWANEKRKKVSYKGYLKHIMYMTGFYRVKSNRLPSSDKRYFLK